MISSRKLLDLGARLGSCLVACLFAVSPALADEAGRGGDNSIAIFGGQATDTNFTESMFLPWTNDMKDIGVIAASFNHRHGEVADYIGDVLPFGLAQEITIESEVGASYRFGDEDLGEAWLAAYLRYDGFFWNDVVYTTLAVNTGLSMLTEVSEFERGRDSGGEASKLLHYMGPEITFASPDHKNMELLLRFHHRSGVFGLFDGTVSGSTFISSGLRFRF
jgi:hypothetical protein